MSGASTNTGSNGLHTPVPRQGGSASTRQVYGDPQPRGQNVHSAGAKGPSSHVPATGTPNKPNQQKPHKPGDKKAIPKAKGISSLF